VSTTLGPTAPAVRRAAFHPLAVASVERLCDDAVAVTFDVPAELAADYTFAPGQSLTLRRTVEGQEQRRSYSICAAAGRPPRVGVREVPGGLFSSWLMHEVSAGDVVEVQTPTGSFSADPAAGGRHVLSAAGSGITPVLSIAASLLRDSDARVSLLYGNRRTSTVMFAEELGDLKNEYGPRLDLIHVLSREPRDVELFSGRLDAERIRALLLALVPVEVVDHFWLCGPYAMITEARRVLGELGVAPGQVHLELFYVDEVPPEPVRPQEAANGDEPSSDVTLVLDGRSSRLRLPRSAAILDSAQKSRSDLPFACKGGVCGTAGPGSPPARSTCAATTPSNPPSSRPGSCSPARAIRSRTP
jgi:ring-1,2-phenylacetyl-CoA epoxidase subunit PaaE